jgi:D-alanyl-D-alanine carboxypeptidase
MSVFNKKIPLLTVLCVALGSFAALAGVSWPDTAAAQLAKKRLQAFNSGNAADLQQFKTEHEPDMQLERELAFRQMVGGFEALRVDQDSAGKVTVIIREQDGDRVGSLILQLDDKNPQKVSHVSLLPMSSVPADLMPTRLSETEAQQRLLHKAEKLLAEDQFAGNVRVARRGEVRLEKSFGLARRDPEQKNEAGTRFRIASMFKMFTAVAILQLVEKGQLQLDAPLISYLPDYPNAALAKQTTLRHLLTHTGGTGDIFTDSYQQQRLNIRQHADYLRLFGEREAEFKPGSREAYSNYGYVLLGAVIERVSGQSYYTYVDNHIFKPTGMTATGAEPEEKVRELLSVGYTHTEQGLSINTDSLPWRGTAAGGGYSTVGDLHLFALALLNGTLVSEQTLAEATRSQTASGLYGYGFQLGGEGETRHFGHIGGAEGMNGALRIYPATGDIVIALSTMDPPGAEMLVEYYSNRMPLQSAVASGTFVSSTKK